LMSFLLLLGIQNIANDLMHDKLVFSSLLGERSMLTHEPSK